MNNPEKESSVIGCAWIIKFKTVDVEQYDSQNSIEITGFSKLKALYFSVIQYQIREVSS